MRECVFSVSHYRKSSGVLVVRCSLTGSYCVCLDPLSYLTCPTREYALKYQASHRLEIDPRTA